jgi:deazaflavin-dependent oxidoreductase (nitroreductase family)
MDSQIRQALGRSQLVDITTTGRRTGLPRRIELTTHAIGGHAYISGMPSPRTRAWLRNLIAEPRFTFHLRGAVAADLPATARVITDRAERRAVLEGVARSWNRADVDRMVELSPLIEVLIDGLAPAATA